MGYSLGIDESGKGNLLGNLIVAGVIVDSSTDLRAMVDVKDSKAYSSDQSIRVVEEKYKNVFKVVYSEAEPVLIDQYVGQGHRSLNTLLMLLMVETCVKALNTHDIECIFIDSPVSNCNKWSTELRRMVLDRLDNPFVGFLIVCENRAESKFKQVALASIFARCRWLSHMQDISNEIYHSTGIRIKSGVTTERECRLFVDTCPSSKFIRKSWKI